MHTLVPVTTPTEGKELYNIYLIHPGYERKIMSNLNYSESIRMVNYLNGGPGWDMNNPEIGKYEIQV